jgi:hypothetical protein
VLAPGEVAAQGKLYVVSRGLILFGGRVLGTGAVWGDDVILSFQSYFLPHLARAMSYVDVYTIPREKLTRIVLGFPNSLARLRRHTILLALRRHLSLALRQARERGELSTSPSHQTDMIDRSFHEDVSGPTNARNAKVKSVNMAVEYESLLSDEGSTDHFSPAPRGGGHRGPRGGSFEAGHDLTESTALAMQTEMRQMREEIRSVAKAVDAITTVLLSSTASRRQPTLPRCASLTASAAGSGASGEPPGT